MPLSYQTLSSHVKAEIGCFSTTRKIDKDSHESDFMEAMAFRKKDPSKHSVGAGISLPADLKAKATEIAARQDQSLSAYVKKLLRDHLQQIGESLEETSKAIQGAGQILEDAAKGKLSNPKNNATSRDATR